MKMRINKLQIAMTLQFIIGYTDRNERIAEWKSIDSFASLSYAPVQIVYC